MDNNRIKEFINNALLEIYTTENKILSIGLKYGYSKYMLNLGFPRKEQIKILDFLQDKTKTELKNFGVLL